MKLTKIVFGQLKQQLEDEVKKEYNKASIIFSTASPFGQILTVVESLGALVFQYIENIVSEFNIYFAKYRKSVRGLSRLSGHNPFRAISATGTLKLKLRPTVEIADEINGSKFTLLNNTLIKNRTNSLYYLIQIGQDRITYPVLPNFEFSVNIIQGKFQFQTYTSNGRALQTFSVHTRGFDIENFSTLVFVNGSLWANKVHLYDLLPDEPGVVITTGFSGGIDILFGNGSYGKIPEIGTTILVRYIVTDGSKGNIVLDRLNDWDFIDPVLDSVGAQVDMAGIFDISTESQINFGSDGETIEYTRAITPYISRNFVLALPENYAYFLGALKIFSYVDAYTNFDDNDPNNDRTIYLYLIPNLKIYTNGGSNYFDLPEDVFYLDQSEKNKIVKYLKIMGNMVVGTNLQIVDVILRRYIIFINIIVYEDAQQDIIRNQILETCSNYFLVLQRRDRVPRSDIEALIESIPGIDSVEIIFKSEQNETYHRQGQDAIKKIQTDSRTATVTGTNNIVISGYDPKRIIGLDNILGDIILQKNELAIIRGGWYDRQNIYYNPAPTVKGLSAVNITITGTTRKKLNTNV